MGEKTIVLKLVWVPGAPAAPDETAYKQAVDTLTATFGDQTAEARFPRSAPPADADLAQLGDLVSAWLAARTVRNTAAKLMLHGYDYDPRHPGDAAYDPFMTIYGYPATGGLDPRLSWLPLVEEADDRGSRRQETAIAFAWVSTGSFAEYGAAGWSEPYQYACVDLAHLAAQAVAAVVRIVAVAQVPVDVLTHSLGTRLLTQTVAALGGDGTTINNIVMLDGAEFSVDAAATFADTRFNVVNVTNEVDAVLTAGAEQFGDPSRVPGSAAACSLGRYGLGTLQSWAGIARYPQNWVDIALDRRDVQAWFKANGGYSLTPTASDTVHPAGHMNHWACYTEPGNRAWLMDLLWKPGMNGGTLARAEGLPKGILRGAQPVIAGVGIPTTTPMTAADRRRFQLATNNGGGNG
jgi:hypothetical protein